MIPIQDLDIQTPDRSFVNGKSDHIFRKNGAATNCTECIETSLSGQSMGDNRLPLPVTVAKGVNASGANRRLSLNKYGTTAESPRDDAVYYATDDNFTVFARGRDYEPVTVTHQYTAEERKTLASFESFNYFPSHSQVYQHWIKRQWLSRWQLDRWLMMGMIGILVGLLAFLLHQLIEKVSDVKWETTQDILRSHHINMAWLFNMGYSVVIVLFSASIIIFWRPSAGGSGIPEVTGFLNGTHIRHIFNIQTLVVKFLSTVAAIGCGMPLGPEGPMIHLGALVGAGVSQFRSGTLGFKLPYFQRFRNSEDRRNFVSAGAAAGVAAAFGAPLGGLLYSMEEVSSFWRNTLSWQIFFCCILAVFTSDLLNSAFEGFHYTGTFGQFKLHRYILFSIDKGVDVNILMFLPTILLGALGGLLGALFTILNLKIARLRRRLLARMKAKWKQNLFRLTEPAVLMVIVTAFSVYVPAAFPCTNYTCIQSNSTEVSKNCLNDTTNEYNTDYSLTKDYTCVLGNVWRANTTWHTNSTYNEMASLLFETMEVAVKNLFKHNTHLMFGYPSLFVALGFFFFFVCWASGTSVAGGFLVPMLLVGSLYGRIVGLFMVSIFGVNLKNGNPYLSWIDPGAFALIGAASFMGGVTRLTLTVTVIMMELTNAVQVLLPVMMSVMVAKWFGDFFTHPIFHAQLESKCIPFLVPEPRVRVMGKSIRLELYTVKEVMASPVRTVCEIESVKRLAELLLGTSHGGFPVVRKTEPNRYVFRGSITRLELMVLLMKEDLFTDGEQHCKMTPDEQDVSWVEYEELLIDKLADPAWKAETLDRYIQDEVYLHKFLDLTFYINESALSIPRRFSLQRTYIIFRTLGLRHLTVVDDHNEVVGIVTRKDLMGFNLVECLTRAVIREMSQPAHNKAVAVSEETLGKECQSSEPV